MEQYSLQPFIHLHHSLATGGTEFPLRWGMTTKRLRQYHETMEQ